MSWFKKDEKVPEIPKAPSIPDLPELENKKELPELPSFPNNTLNEGFNREIVKSAVNDDSSYSNSSEVEVNVEELPREFKLDALPPQNQFPPRMQSSIMNDLMSSQPLRQSPKKEEDSNKPIFVRIDRFNESKKEFEDIKKTVKEIENTLRKLKENKSKEDTEIMNWTINLEDVKAKLAEIDSNIFNKL
jgi:hypothetical protein